MPSISAQPFHEDVGDHRTNVQAFAGEANVDCTAHHTSAPVCADEIAGPERCDTLWAADTYGNTLGVLHEPFEFDAIFRAPPKFR